ncbi:MAG: hypothetical protein JWO25_2036 [Alphaproteobacteria bacterium]|nr:hypothetical protein [Alphaproteobacteria bacterium]
MEAEGREEQISTDSGRGSYPAAAPRRRAALGWLLLLVLIAGLAALCWPRLELLMRRGAVPVAPPSGVAAPGGAAQVAARPAKHDYPPCTATRTDSCVQKDGK